MEVANASEEEGIDQCDIQPRIHVSPLYRRVNYSIADRAQNCRADGDPDLLYD